MATKRFSLDSLANLDDGRIRAAFELALQRCEHDCKDRPAVMDVRKITLACSIAPVLGPDGEMDSCNVQFQITDTIPKRQSKVYNMLAHRDGLLFNDLSPEDIHQQTLDEAKGPKVVPDAG